MIPGEYELYLFGHRRPELYGALVEETQAVQAKGGKTVARDKELVPDPVLNRAG